MVLISGAIDSSCLTTSSNIDTTVPLSWLHFSKTCTRITITGTDPGEVKCANSPPPPFFREPPSFFLFFLFFSLITSTRLWFYYIITKIHPPPPFQNTGSAPASFSPWHLQLLRSLSLVRTCVLWLNRHLEYGIMWNDSSVR